MIKRLLKLAVFTVALGAVLWVLRENLLPMPQVPQEPPPHFRSSPPPPPAERPDDLQAVKGIGPVYAAALTDLHITSFAQLAAADPSRIAAALDVSTARVDEWIEQAKQHLD